MREDYSYTGEIGDDKEQELWNIESWYKLALTWVYGQIFCQYVDYGKKDRWKKSCCFFDKGKRKGFYQDIVVENEKQNGVAVDQSDVKGGVHKIVIYDVKAPAYQGDERIFPLVMVYLEHPFPDEEKEKVDNPCSKG